MTETLTHTGPQAPSDVPPRPPPPVRPSFWRRRRFLVDVRLQGSLLLSFLLHMLVFCCVLSVALFLPLILAIRAAAVAPTRASLAARQMIALDARFWPALLGALVLVALLSVRTSHALAGPLYRFRRVYEALLRREDPGSVRLRKHDYLQPEAATLECLVRQVVADRAHMGKLRDDLRLILADLPEDGGPDGLAQRLAALLDEEEGG